MPDDLGHYLGAEFKGEPLDQLRPRASRSRACRCITSVGALDPARPTPT